MAFPAHVNLIFGDRWCLAKLDSGACPAAVVGVEVLLRRRAWKHADFRWLLSDAQVGGREGYLIRTDHTPHRKLRGGIPVMLDDDGSWFRRHNANHLWYFEYPSFVDGESGSFCIRSVQSQMYLTVDATGKLVLETGKPEMFWKYHDATKKYKAFTGRSRGESEVVRSLSTKSLGADTTFWEKWTERSGVETLYWHDGKGGQHPIGKGGTWEGPVQLDEKGWMYWTDSNGNNERCRPSRKEARQLSNYATVARAENRAIVVALFTKSPAKSSGTRSSPALNGDGESPIAEDDEDEEEKLEAFEGSPSKAFETMVAKQLGSQAARAYGSDNPFMLLDKMLEKKVDLCDDTNTLPFPEDMTVADIFPALYGAQSDLFRRFHERRNDTALNFSPPHPFSAEGVSWASVATLTCKVPIPILGVKPYKEIQRLVLCRQGEEITLAVQTLGKVVAGWYGEFVSENVYFFSQANSKAPIRFKAITPAPTGTFAKNQLDGARKSLSDFVTVAKEILQDWSANTPSSNAQRRFSNGAPDESPTKGIVPVRGQASVMLPARPASEPALGWFPMCSCDMSVSGDGELVVVHDK